MVESRCGICCTKNERCKKWGFDCDGCANIESAPWGVCEIKVCCKNKGHEHCGECEVFPCDTLKSFSHDETHGDGGARIEQCKKWCGLW